MTEQKQDKATARPWMLSSSTLVCSQEAAIIAQCANIEPIGVKFSEAAANAALIVKAVNEYSALCAVEQAAKDFERMHSDQVFICGREDEEMVEYNLANLVECLAALAKLRP